MRSMPIQKHGSCSFTIMDSTVHVSIGGIHFSTAKTKHNIRIFFYFSLPCSSTCPMSTSRRWMRYTLIMRSTKVRGNDFGTKLEAIGKEHSLRCVMSVLVFAIASSILQVTVLLSANVGFLAIQSVDTSAEGPHRSVAQIASYVSTLFSLGSYLIWWILSRQHPPGSQASAADAVSSIYPTTIVCQLSAFSYR